MNEASRLAYLIEVNRQRLQYAIETENSDLTSRISHLLAQLHAQYFNETKQGVFMERKQKSQNETNVLVFSEKHPDGAVLTWVEYRNLCKVMSREDRETHVMVEVAKEMSGRVEQEIMLAASDSKKETA